MRWSAPRRCLTTALVSGLAGWLGGVVVFRTGARTDHTPDHKSLTERLAASAPGRNGVRERTAPVPSSAAGLKAAGVCADFPPAEELLRQLREKLDGGRGLVTPKEGMSYQELADAVAKMSEIQQLVQQAFAYYPEATLQFLAQLPPGHGGESLVHQLLHRFTPETLPLVKSWIQQLPPGNFRNAAVQAAFKQLSLLDPQGAEAMVRASEGTETFARLRDWLVGSMDASAGFAFIRSLPPQAQVEYWSAARGDFPGKEAVEEMTRVLDAPARARVLEGIFTRCAKGDPVYALTATRMLQDEAQQYAIARKVVEEWSARDSWLASRHAAALPLGVLRDAAAAGLATDLAESNPEAAARWAALIAHPARREAVLKTLAAPPPPPPP